MKTKFLSLITVLLAQPANAIDLAMIESACSQSTEGPCLEYSSVKKEVEKNLLLQVKSIPYHEAMGAVAVFLIDPKLQIQTGAHKFKLDPKSVQYTYNF